MIYPKNVKNLFTESEVHGAIIRASQNRMIFAARFVNVSPVPALTKKWKHSVSGGIEMKNMKKTMAHYVEYLEAAMASYMEYVSRVRN